MPTWNGRRKDEPTKLVLKPPPFTEARPLTKRELEVVEWIAAGKRNAEIGQILGCSSRTVQKHVQHILEKLHLETRIAVCIWWYEHRIDGTTAQSSPRRTAAKLNRRFKPDGTSD
jgi:DNA-binding CsgD family transcriptional regulator